jgi:multidrug efflux pump
MNNLVSTVINSSRTTLSVLVMIIIAGVVARLTIPVEADSAVDLPMIMITVPHPGISPEDGDRLIVRPMETELRSLEGLDELTSYARESVASMILEFDADYDVDVAMNDTRAAVDRAQAEIPSTTEEPIVKAVSLTDFPVIVVSLASDVVPERRLYQMALKLRREIETVPDVLEARLSGHREELLEAIIDPTQLEFYSISQQEVFNAVRNNNRLIAAGAMDTGQGRFAVKVPGLIETRQDVFNLPIKSTGDTVVTLDKIANVRRTFKDRENYSRINGRQALSIEVLRRPHSNLIDTNTAVREIVEEYRKTFPPEVRVEYSQDQAPFAGQQVTELQGNMVTAMALVMIVVVAALGIRSGILVGFAVPVAFLAALIFLRAMGYTFNFMVMFGMLLGLGMLIDGSIVVTEYADRKMAEGVSSRDAYIAAARRMFWPVVASTATTLAAFLPLFFWPGMSGEFMIFLPITVFAVLTGALLYSLFFGPTLGAMFGRVGATSDEDKKNLHVLEHGDPLKLPGATGLYARLLRQVIRHPFVLIVVVFAVLISIFNLYGRYGAGFIYFTDTDPTFGRVSINARGNFSKEEILELVLEAEEAVLSVEGIESIYTTTSARASFYSRGNTPPDQIGAIHLEIDKNSGISGLEVLENVRGAVEHLAGIHLEVEEQEYGPVTGKDIQIQLASKFRQDLPGAVAGLKARMEQLGGLRDIEDTRPLPGIEWQLVVDRAQAALFNANIDVVGGSVQLVTNGIYLGEFRPDDAEEEVEIRLRYPETQRNIDVLDQLRVNTPSGSVPLSNFVTRAPQNKVDSIQRVDGEYVMFVRANVMPGVIADNKVSELKEWLATADLPTTLRVDFKGASEEQAESLQFIGFAFIMSLLLMFVLLVTQFNSFYQAFLILSSVMMSTAGVLLGLLTFQQTFSAILTGIGIVALAGIVVNNNIVLIDTFNHLRRQNPQMDIASVIIRTGAQRLRPVILTTATTVLGLLPLATNISIDLVNREIVYGSQVSAYWVKLASSIVYGLSFATVLTLVVTPALLIVPHTLSTMTGHARDLVRRKRSSAQA